jgi:hypothetical protein
LPDVDRRADRVKWVESVDDHASRRRTSSRDFTGPFLCVPIIDDG